MFKAGDGALERNLTGLRETRLVGVGLDNRFARNSRSATPNFLQYDVL